LVSFDTVHDFNIITITYGYLSLVWIVLSCLIISSPGHN